MNVIRVCFFFFKKKEARFTFQSSTFINQQIATEPKSQTSMAITINTSQPNDDHECVRSFKKSFKNIATDQEVHEHIETYNFVFGYSVGVTFNSFSIYEVSIG